MDPSCGHEKVDEIRFLVFFVTHGDSQRFASSESLRISSKSMNRNMLQFDPESLFMYAISQMQSFHRAAIRAGSCSELASFLLLTELQSATVVAVALKGRIRLFEGRIASGY